MLGLVATVVPLLADSYGIKIYKCHKYVGHGILHVDLRFKSNVKLGLNIEKSVC